MRAILPLLLLTTACQAAPSQPQTSTASTLGQRAPLFTYRIVNTYPHDPRAFTQGLFWLDGTLYESTGQEGESTLRRVNLEDGRVLQRTDLPREVFGEGSTPWGDQILSITWQDGIGYRWDRRTFRQVGTWRYEGEGWGLANDGTHIIMSNGSDRLKFLDPATLREVRAISVRYNGQPLPKLNELEYIRGEIWANVWETGRIARIDPASGNVTGMIDLTGLVQANRGGGADVLNGIAYDAERDRIFVTGKYWPRLYEIALVPAS